MKILILSLILFLPQAAIAGFFDSIGDALKEASGEAKEAGQGITEWVEEVPAVTGDILPEISITDEEKGIITKIGCVVATGGIPLGCAPDAIGGAMDLLFDDDE
uniref:Uncharacterized protein n=1 Tax=Candidatus Kentrum sp. DK TaxID=2126562 RepID=A0A450TGV2_9GAMM|nr:MAG: hypothetical protein BECKDK2373C_GA0170839_11474 [Candidatus Kentron sp. DK]